MQDNVMASKTIIVYPNLVPVTPCLSLSSAVASKLSRRDAYYENASVKTTRVAARIRVLALSTPLFGLVGGFFSYRQ